MLPIDQVFIEDRRLTEWWQDWFAMIQRRLLAQGQVFLPHNDYVAGADGHITASFYQSLIQMNAAISAAFSQDLLLPSPMAYPTYNKKITYIWKEYFNSVDKTVS